MSLPQDLRYTKDHEWCRLAGAVATVGITRHAAEQLGDIVFVELPKVGATVAQGTTFGVVESVKAVSDLYSPVSGTVVEVNAVALDTPSTVNEQPYDAGWLVKIELSAPGQLGALMDSAAYEAHVAAG